MPRLLTRGGAVAVVTVLSLSPPVFSLAPLPGNQFFFLAIVAIAASYTSRMVRVWPLVIYALLLMTATLSGTLTGSLAYPMYTIYIGATLLLMARHRTGDLADFSDMLDVIVAIGLGLAVLSFLAYIAHPTPPLLTVPNPDGRPNGLYYLTFTNAAFGGFIRPAFIFDEPGAFSFVICIAAAARELLGKRRNVTVLFLIGGLVTLSLTHILVTALYMLRYAGSPRLLAPLAGIVVLGGMVMMASDIDISGPAQLVTSRLEVGDGGRLAGDNRSQQVDNFLRVVDWDVVLFGIPRCLDPKDLCRDLGDMSSNPFTVIVNFGILVAWPYYLLLAGLLGLSVARPRLLFPALALILLLLQRPNLFVFGYAALIVPLVALIVAQAAQGRRGSPVARA